MSFDFDTVVVPFKMQPGLRRLAPGVAQLTPNFPGSLHLAEKLAALGHHREQALLCAPGFDPGPALDALARHAALEHPNAFARHGTDRLEALALGWSVSGGDVVGTGAPEIGALLRALPAPWRAPALLCLAFAEDFAVIDGRDATIPWLAVCLPSRWAPESKLGHHFAEVHAPVADNALLVAASDHLARLVTGAARWERFVWSIGSEARLMQHPAHVAPTAWPADAQAEALGRMAIFRTERQSFIPLPELGQAVFTIHVESRPLAEAIDTPARARKVHDSLASMSPSVLAYRSLAEARDRLLAWLAARAE